MSFLKEFKKEGSLIKVITRLSAIGLTLVFCIFIGLAVGVLIDKKFGTSPWGMLGFLL